MSGVERIAYLGDMWSFHHIAALHFLGADGSFTGYDSFDAIIHAVLQGDADKGILAVENSILGDVDENFKRISSAELQILGEEILHIRLHLAAKEKTPISSIRKILSHPAALQQAEKFLQALNHIEIEEVASTASAMRHVAESADLTTAALGNTEAIEKYHLQIIAENVADVAENFTRFFIFCKKSAVPVTTKKANKASILLHIPENTDRTEVPGRLLTGIAGIVLNRVINSHTVYIETEFTQGAQFDDILFKLAQNGCRTEVLGMYSRAVNPQ